MCWLFHLINAIKTKQGMQWKHHTLCVSAKQVNMHMPSEAIKIGLTACFFNAG